MADYQQNTPVEDPAASTQMFRAFVDEPATQPATAHTANGGGSRSGMTAAVVIVVLAVIAAVAYFLVK